jgi:vacuolar iron transporter family protein
MSMRCWYLVKYNSILGIDENRSHSNFLSDFILGSQDGLVNVLGILLGVSAATNDIRLIFVAALAALGAEAISMGAVAYTSTLARQKQYIREVEKEQQEMKKNPNHSKKQLRGILKNWGYKGKELEELTMHLASNQTAALELLVSFERNMQPVGKGAPLRSFFTVLSSTTVGSIIPLLPFLFTRNVGIAAVAAVIVSGITLFVIGYYEAKTTVGSLWKSGLQMLVIGLTAGLVGYLIGHFIGAVPI